MTEKNRYWFEVPRMKFLLPRCPKCNSEAHIEISGPIEGIRGWWDGYAVCDCGKSFSCRIRSHDIGHLIYGICQSYSRNTCSKRKRNDRDRVIWADKEDPKW